MYVIMLICQFSTIFKGIIHPKTTTPTTKMSLFTNTHVFQLIVHNLSNFFVGFEWASVRSVIKREIQKKVIEK